MFNIRNIIAIFFSVYVGVAQASDPTRPLTSANALTPIGGAVTEQETIKLTSILMASDRRVAIINDQALHEKQVIKGTGAVVKKIDADAVVLQQGEKIWRVSLNKTVIRK